MGRHGFFILFAYGLAAVAITAMVAYVLADYRRLRNGLAKFPPREGDERE